MPAGLLNTDEGFLLETRGGFTLKMKCGGWRILRPRWEVSLVLHIVMGAFFLSLPAECYRPRRVPCCCASGVTTHPPHIQGKNERIEGPHSAYLSSPGRTSLRFSAAKLFWAAKMEGELECLIFHGVTVQSKASVVPCKVSPSCHASAAGS